MLKLIILAAVVAAAVAVYRLYKAKKAVTAGSVAAGVQTEVSSAVSAVKSDVSKS